MLWEVDIYPNDHGNTQESARIRAALEEIDGGSCAEVVAGYGYLLQGESLSRNDVNDLVRQLLADAVVEEAVVAEVGSDELSNLPEGVAPSPARLGNGGRMVHVMPKRGVMDPVAQSAEQAAADVVAEPIKVRSFRKYWICGVSAKGLDVLCQRHLANDAIEQVVQGPLLIDNLDAGSEYQFELNHTALASLDDDALMRLSKDAQLYLQLEEMRTIQRFFAELERDPTDIELETLAQTWSEHCSHKTLAGRIAYRDENGERQFENMLKETIFAATQKIRAKLGDDDWCVSVFQDNAGVVHFEGETDVCFKVETHNHPSALEPYGGANTGLGGVIRDILGTGLGAKPIASTDVFCFAPPNTSEATLPAGVLHPRRVMEGVVAGVRDYGNRMGIPTVNGAVFFDERYLGNPLVFCGSVGVMPRSAAFGDPQPGDMIVAVGGRTGRDGIHGATFSSAELTSESETLSGGAVQIGNPIEEKKVLDRLLVARDRGLYTAVTDCGAGGFSSAVGEMGEKIGAEVWLERAPLKYDGLSYTEIWISEAQERMVLSVPEQHVEELVALFAAEDVEATVLGRFTPTGQLTLKYENNIVGELPMSFLHDGRPPTVRQAEYLPAQPIDPASTAKVQIDRESAGAFNNDLLALLSDLNIASKEWIIRQYDHEVQGGSVVKPLIGPEHDGPSDAAVVRPVLTSQRGLVLACGMQPLLGDLDPYWMAASAIDEAMRNCVAVGADPARIALLDNFCWGDCERKETLGSLVRAALACHDLAVEFGTPFISGKDSLNNEFSFVSSDGVTQTIAIPSTLLISAMGQIADVRQCVTMDLKTPGNRLYLVGSTKEEMGGSHWHRLKNLDGGEVPKVDPPVARVTFVAMHQAISQGLIRACHDLSEGGLAVAAAEMAFAGRLGCTLDLTALGKLPAEVACFSESNSRFLVEVTPENAAEFERQLAEVPLAKMGEAQEGTRLVIQSPSGVALIDAEIDELRQAWQEPLSPGTPR